MIRDYKDLIVWQKSMDLAEEIYRLVKLLPKEETYALSDQMRRAAISVPSNIAEGYQRNTDKDLRHFLCIAKGSVAELETQVLLCTRLKYIPEGAANNVQLLTEEVAKMLSAFISRLNADS